MEGRSRSMMQMMNALERLLGGGRAWRGGWRQGSQLEAVELVSPGEAAGLELEVCTGEKRSHLGDSLKVELTGLGDRMDEESAGSRLRADPGVVGPEHLVMER